MDKILNLLSIFLLAQMFGACTHEPSFTEVFSKYLYENFDQQISASNHHYVIIPVYGCKGCMKSVFGDLSYELVKHKDHITWIVSGYQEKYSSKLINYHCLWDTNRVIENIRLPIANITIISVKNGEVLQIKNLDSKQDGQLFISSLTNSGF